MYTGMYKKDSKNIYVKLVAVFIIAFALGALLVSGQGGEIPPAADTDSIEIVPLSMYDYGPASDIYYSLTERELADDGYDRCVIATYNVAKLEVNGMIYSIEVSDQNAMIFIVRMNESESGYTEIERFQMSGTIKSGQIQFAEDYNIAIIVFYIDNRLVIIEATFDYW